MKTLEEMSRAQLHKAPHFFYKIIFLDTLEVGSDAGTNSYSKWRKIIPLRHQKKSLGMQKLMRELANGFDWTR